MEVYIVDRAINGAIVGVSLALTGYAKTSGEEFDVPKFATTIAIGALVGLGTQFTGIDYQTLNGYLATAGVTALVENTIKAGWRYIKAKLTTIAVERGLQEMK